MMFELHRYEPNQIKSVSRDLYMFEPMPFTGIFRGPIARTETSSVFTGSDKALSSVSDKALSRISDKASTIYNGLDSTCLFIST